MIDAGFSDGRVKIGTEILQRRVRVFQTDIGHLLQGLRQLIEAYLLPDKLDIAHLLHSCRYRLVQVRGLTVHLTIDSAADLAKDADILKVHQANVRFHQPQEIRQPIAFFYVYDVILLAQDDLRVHIERLDEIANGSDRTSPDC